MTILRLSLSNDALVHTLRVSSPPPMVSFVSLSGRNIHYSLSWRNLWRNPLRKQDTSWESCNTFITPGYMKCQYKYKLFKLPSQLLYFKPIDNIFVGTFSQGIFILMPIWNVALKTCTLKSKVSVTGQRYWKYWPPVLLLYIIVPRLTIQLDHQEQFLC